MSRLLPIVASLLFALGCAALLWWTSRVPALRVGTQPRGGTQPPTRRAEAPTTAPAPEQIAGRAAPGVATRGGSSAPPASEEPPGRRPWARGPTRSSVEGERIASAARALEGPTIAPIDVDALPRDLALSPDELAEVLEPMQPLLLRCFEDVAGRNPGDRHVELELRIETDRHGASLSRARILDSDIVDPMALACLEDTPLDVAPQGPGREASVRLRYPVRFRQ